MNGQSLDNQNNQTNGGEINTNVLGELPGQALGQVPDAAAGLVNSEVPPAQPMAVPPAQPEPVPQAQPIPQPDAMGTPTTVDNSGAGTESVANVPPVASEPTIVNPAGETVSNNSPVTDSMPNSGMIPPTGIDPMGTANSNGFVDVNKNENIGVIPPDPESGGKKPINKVAFIIVVVGLIAVVAYGVYYYLSASKSKVTVVPKDISIALGDNLSSNPDDYATITGTSSSNCILNILNVDNHTAGTYEYTLTCNDNVYKGNVTVTDTLPPTASMKIVYKTINSTVIPDEFVEKCEDPSGCKMTLADETGVRNYLTTAGGPNNIDITLTDSVGNSNTESGILYVVPSDIKLFRLCSSAPEPVTSASTTVTRISTDRLTIGQDETGQLYYLGAGRREYKYTFADKESYDAVVGIRENTLTYDNKTGFAIYDDENLSVTISTDLDINTLNTESGGTFATDFASISAFYEGKENYTCQNALFTN